MEDVVNEAIAEIIKQNMRGIEYEFGQNKDEWPDYCVDKHKLCEQLLEIFN